ncbi:MAG: hypothetical protein U0235_17575 [Polyangiaceae bacterium]
MLPFATGLYRPLGVPRVDGIEHPVPELLVADPAVDQLGDAGVAVAEATRDDFQGHPKVDKPLSTGFAERMRPDVGDAGVASRRSEVTAEVREASKQRSVLALGMGLHELQEGPLLVGDDRHPPVSLRGLAASNGDEGPTDFQLGEVISESTVESGLFGARGNDECCGGGGVLPQLRDESLQFVAFEIPLLGDVRGVEVGRDDRIEIAPPPPPLHPELQTCPDDDDLFVDGRISSALGPPLIDVRPEGRGVADTGERQVVAENPDDVACRLLVELDRLLGAAVIAGTCCPVLQDEVQRRFEGVVLGSTIRISRSLLPVGENGPSRLLVRISGGALGPLPVDVDRRVPDLAPPS